MEIKELRMLSGLSQQAFSEKYGIPKRSIENWESGKRNPPEYVISLLERAVKEDIKKMKKREENIMKINGIGVINKKEAMSILTKEGREAVNAGEISMEELGAMYKLEQVKKACSIGRCSDTFRSNYSRIPENLKEKLSTQELADLVEAFYKCYGDGKNA